MNRTTQVSLMSICSAVIIFNFSSCKYEDGPSLSLRTKKSRLVGKWEAKIFEGDVITNTGDTQFEVIVEFEDDNDLLTKVRYQYSYTYNGQTVEYDYSYTYLGTWEWESGKRDIVIQFDTNRDDSDFNAEILKLSNDELSFLDEDGDKYEFIKID